MAALHLLIGLPGSISLDYVNQLSGRFFNNAVEAVLNRELQSLLMNNREIIYLTDSRFCDDRVFAVFFQLLQRYTTDISLVVHDLDACSCCVNVSSQLHAQRLYQQIFCCAAVYNPYGYGKYTNRLTIKYAQLSMKEFSDSFHTSEEVLPALVAPNTAEMTTALAPPAPPASLAPPENIIRFELPESSASLMQQPFSIFPRTCASLRHLFILHAQLENGMLRVFLTEGHKLSIYAQMKDGSRAPMTTYPDLMSGPQVLQALHGKRLRHLNMTDDLIYAHLTENDRTVGALLTLVLATENGEEKYSVLLHFWASVQNQGRLFARVDK